jgi:hypothetical protein
VSFLWFCFLVREGGPAFWSWFYPDLTCGFCAWILFDMAFTCLRCV